MNKFHFQTKICKILRKKLVSSITKWLKVYFKSTKSLPYPRIPQHTHTHHSCMHTALCSILCPSPASGAFLALPQQPCLSSTEQAHTDISVCLHLSYFRSGFLFLSSAPTSPFQFHCSFPLYQSCTFTLAVPLEKHQRPLSLPDPNTPLSLSPHPEFPSPWASLTLEHTLNFQPCSLLNSQSSLWRSYLAPQGLLPLETAAVLGGERGCLWWPACLSLFCSLSILLILSWSWRSPQMIWIIISQRIIPNIPPSRWKAIIEGTQIKTHTKRERDHLIPTGFYPEV